MAKVNYRLRDRERLVDLMEFRDESVRSLATKVACSPATIGHLRSGHRSFVRREWAKAIENELRVPRGSLFAPHLSTVVPHTRNVVASQLRPAA